MFKVNVLVSKTNQINNTAPIQKNIKL